MVLLRNYTSTGVSSLRLSKGKLVYDATQNLVLFCDGSVYKQIGVKPFTYGVGEASTVLSLDASSNVSGINAISCTSLTVNGVAITGNSTPSELTGITPGIASASKAVVLNSSLGVSGLGAISCSSLTVNGVAITSGGGSSTELTGVTAGTAAANKAVVLNSSKNISGMGNISCSGLTITGSGTTIYIGDYAVGPSVLANLWGITPGTASASKAVVLNSSLGVSGLGAISCSSLTVNGVSITTNGGGSTLNGASTLTVGKLILNTTTISLPQNHLQSDTANNGLWFSLPGNSITVNITSNDRRPDYCSIVSFGQYYYNASISSQWAKVFSTFLIEGPPIQTTNFQIWNPLSFHVAKGRAWIGDVATITNYPTVDMRDVSQLNINGSSGADCTSNHLSPLRIINTTAAAGTGTTTPMLGMGMMAHPNDTNTKCGYIQVSEGSAYNPRPLLINQMSEPAGNVSIGSLSYVPQTQLEIGGGGNMRLINKTSGLRTPTTGSGLEFYCSNSIGNIIAGVRTSGTISARHALNFNDFMTLSNNGRLGIGTTTPRFPLDITTSNTSPTSFSYMSMSGNTALVSYASDTSGGPTDKLFSYPTTATVETTAPTTVSVYTSGSILCGGAVHIISDYRKKENFDVLTLDYCNSFIEKAKPIAFNYKNNKNSKTFGYVAQELIKNDFDALINIAKDEDIEQYIDDQGYVSPAGWVYNVNSLDIIPILHVALKDSKDKINDLENTVKELQDKINLIMSKLS